jgi:hypothetical protein
VARSLLILWMAKDPAFQESSGAGLTMNEEDLTLTGVPAPNSQICQAIWMTRGQLSTFVTGAFFDRGRPFVSVSKKRISIWFYRLKKCWAQILREVRFIFEGLNISNERQQLEHASRHRQP